MNNGNLPVRSDSVKRRAQDSPIEQFVSSNKRKTTRLECELAKRFQNNVARNKSSPAWQPEWDEIISLSPKLKERVEGRTNNPRASNAANTTYIRQAITCSECKKKRGISIMRSGGDGDANYLAKIILDSLKVWKNQGYTNGYQCGRELQVPRELDQPYMTYRYVCNEAIDISDKNILSNLHRASCAWCDQRLGHAEQAVQYEINGMGFPIIIHTSCIA